MALFYKEAFFYGRIQYAESGIFAWRMLTNSDLIALKSKGFDPEEIQWQINFLNSERIFRELIRPATIGDGIIKGDEPTVERWREIFRNRGADLKVEKFVPASGAATRMFKDLFAAMEDPSSNEKANEFFHYRRQFAFYPEDKEFSTVEEWINEVLGKDKMNLGEVPKAFIPFHRKDDFIVSPLQSHVEEFLALLSGGIGEIHFTFSPDHIQHAEEVLKQLFSDNNSVSWKISWQYPSTDTIALDEAGELIRDENGNILFRPGGHGALLKNLNELKGDLVFIRNIDNVQPSWKKDVHLQTSELLGGALLEAQKFIFSALEQLNQGANHPDPSVLVGLKSFGIDPGEISREEWIRLMDRPLRVAGMVINKGEPGGGPFWVRNIQGQASLQIVESSEISSEQSFLLKAGTHFNPVNIAYSSKRYNGTYFSDLYEFMDKEAAFIAEKSVRGRKLLALEHPGLWNGAMSKWLTIFIEIPELAFTPVKTVFDLLRKEHQF